MPKLLTQAQIDSFKADGFVAPIDVLSEEEVRYFRSQLEAFEAEHGGAPLGRDLIRKTHVRESWAAEIARHPRVLDAIEDLIGPDILLYTSTLFIKEPGSEQKTAWHQDATYLGLTPHLHMNAWVALSDASEEAGCLQFLPGSSKQGLLQHRARSAPGSVNHGGQSIVSDIPTEQARSAPLKSGQMSIHHTFAIHGSEPNLSKDRRIGMSLNVIPTKVRHTGSFKMSATLVRGEDQYGHFEHEPDPRLFDKASRIRNHDVAYGLYRDGYEEQIRLHDEPISSS